jgi:glutamine synthetase
VFDGDNYTEEWHAEAESRGLPNLRTTPDALPALIDPGVEAIFEKFSVLSSTELEARAEVLAEQYTTNVNIEGETAEMIARTMLLPAAVRHLAALKAAGVEELVTETEGLVTEFVAAIRALTAANEGHPEDDEGIDLAVWVRDNVIPAMEAVREVADQLEMVVADDLWPLPKYSEILFVK